ncbi:MAG: thymidine kinase [Bacteroidia bacterium]|nr:thymidine kinase [Bacteroidia bacterium]
MFLENLKTQGRRHGHIEVICGSMFSGKTEELIRRLKRARIANQKVEIFKPRMDNRFHAENVVSHDANAIASTAVDTSSALLILANTVDVVGVDEAQFFDDGLPEVCQDLANAGVRVIVAGLDMDFQGEPFGPLPKLMAIAEYVTKVHAICIRCGNLANYSYRTVADNTRILVGEKESYIPLCRTCYNEESGKN